MQQQWQAVYFVKRNPERSPAAFAQVWREHSARGGDCCGAPGAMSRCGSCARGEKGLRD